MRIKHNLTLGGVIMLVVLACMITAGYLWYSHAKAVQRREQRAATVSAAEKKIVIYEDEIKKLSADKKSIELTADVLDPKIKDASDKFSASSAKAKEATEQLAEFRRKMDEARQAVDQYNRELQKSGNANRSTPGLPNPSSQISGIEKNMRTLQKDLEKVECHYNCMGRSNPKSKSRSSDAGTWILSASSSTRSYWVCKRHGYTFTAPIEYLDYKNETARINSSIAKCEKQITELKQSVPGKAEDQPTKLSRFDYPAWNAKLNEAQEIVKKLQGKSDDDRKVLEGLNAERRDLDSKVSGIEHKIEANESQIKEQRLLIADNQK